MKKSIQALGFLLYTSSIFAAEQLQDKDKIEASSVPVAASASSSSTSSQQLESVEQMMQRFRSDPSNFEKVGGVRGWLAADAPKQQAIEAFFSMLIQYNQAYYTDNFTALTRCSVVLEAFSLRTIF